MPGKQRKRQQTRAGRSGRGSSRRARSRQLAAGAEDDVAGEPGVLVAHHGVAVDVRLRGGERRPVKVRRNSGHVVGDRVEVFGERLRRLERDSELRRRDAMGRVHVVAANLDVLGIVVAPKPAPPAGFIDRALVSAASSGIQPLLIVNKADLDGAAALVAAVRRTFVEGPGGVDLPLLEVSAKTGEGLDAILRFLAQGPHRGAFVGTSGVGKSSLVNTLLPEVELEVGAINELSGLGRHTTTTATLHSLSGGGELIDTPGFRDFGLVDIGVRELSRFFPGFAEILGTDASGHDSKHACRFNDCRHLVEPGCAILEAVAEGRLARARWERYRDLLAELEALA